MLDRTHLLSAPLLLAMVSLLCCYTRAYANDDPLEFDVTKYTDRTLTVGDQKVPYRAYEGIVYVSKPLDTLCQSMNIYIPTAYFDGKSIGKYTADTAPIFMPNGIGGYMPATPGSPRRGSGAIAQALARGYVVAAPGARGFTSSDPQGINIGKAPACIVDMKAAVRYLRHNDKIMPGNAEKIISNGTSAGGAVSALIGATGNAPDYEPYLKAIGAATARDDIFAASCYCPITNLDHADSAYEWMFGGVNDYVSRNGKGALTAEQISFSEQLTRLFPSYINSLHLKTKAGNELTLNNDGNGSFKEYVKSYVIASAQTAINQGKNLADLTWVTMDGSSVKDIDFAQYVKYATRMKTPPAFDDLTNASPETGLFGTATVDAQHFTQFGKEHSSDHKLADAAVVKAMNPMYYVGTKGVSVAKHWRIRHGAADRDTSLAIPVILATKLQNTGAQVDFAAPWAQGHGGDYDLPELFAWIDMVCK